MGTTIVLLNPTGSYLTSFLVTLFALAIGTALYYGVRNPDARRWRHKTFFDFNEPVTTRRCAVIVGLLIALPLIVNAYFETWQHFYSVSQDGSQFYLQYLYPTPAVEVSNASGLNINIMNEVRRGYRIVISDKTNHSYSSVIADEQEARENQERLENALKPYRSQ